MTSSLDPIIHVEGLTLGYDDFVLLDEVSFDVHRVRS